MSAIGTRMNMKRRAALYGGYSSLVFDNAESFLPGGRGDCVQVSAVQEAATGRRKTYWTKPHASRCYGY